VSYFVHKKKKGMITTFTQVNVFRRQQKKKTHTYMVLGQRFNLVTHVLF